MKKNKIVVKHSRIEINDYELGDSKLEGIFSIYDRVTHTSFMKGIYYDEENKRLFLPRGIDISYVENIFGEKAVVDYKCDEYDRTESMYIKYLPRDDVQKEALRFMIGEGTNYKYTKGCSQLSVNLNTGKGKTYCTIATIAYVNIKSMIITSSINWLEQWKKCILEYTDTTEKEICILSGSASIFRILQRGADKYKYILASHATIRSYGEKHGWDKVSELFKFLKIGIKVYDESHLDFDNICKIDFYTNTHKTYYVTATPKRSSDEEDRIYQLYFKNVPSIDLFDEDNDPHTKYIAIKYNSNPSPQNISDCKNQYGLDRNKYTNYIVHNDNFYKLLHIILNIILPQEGKSLIYIGTNNSIDIVCQWILTNYPELYGQIGVYNSTVPANIKKEQLEKKLILSTTKSCGPAVDIQGLKNTVVLAEPFKSEILARQTLGRTRNDNTNYIEVVDTGFKYIFKFYKHKKNIFEKYACSCTEITLKQKELDARSDQIILNRQATMQLQPIFIPVEQIQLKPIFKKI